VFGVRRVGRAEWPVKRIFYVGKTFICNIRNTTTTFFTSEEIPLMKASDRRNIKQILFVSNEIKIPITFS